MRPITALAILLLSLVSGSAIMMILIDTAHAQARHPTIDTDQAIYTKSSKTVKLVGAGFTTGTYYIWTAPPSTNITAYSGVSFKPDSNGLVPADTGLEITARQLLGTYVVSVSTSDKTDTALTQAHYGLWGTERSAYQRTEAVIIAGGGLWPTSAVRVNIRDPSGNLVFDAKISAGLDGSFRQGWSLTKDILTGTYNVLIDGTGTFDDTNEDYLSKTSFSVTVATLTVELNSQPDSGYERTLQAKVSYRILYPDNSSVVTLKSGLQPVELLTGSTRLAYVTPTLVEGGAGIWQAAWSIPANASLGQDYRFSLGAFGFDDGFGNSGPSQSLVSKSFEVQPAVLQMKLVSNKTSFEVGFDDIKLLAAVSYPNGTMVVQGTVAASLSHAGWKIDLPMTYSPLQSVWIATRALSLSDVIQSGSWKVTITADDGKGNSGSFESAITVSPIYLFAVIGVAAAVLFLGFKTFRRTKSRYWRRVTSKLRDLGSRSEEPESQED